MRPYFSDSIFTPEECARVIQICEQYGLTKATAYNGTEEVDRPDSRFAEDVRPPRDQNTAWIVDRCWSFIKEANENFQFELSGRALEWCFVKYPVGGIFAEHSDLFGAPKRKITGSIQLSDIGDYDGGELIIRGCRPTSKDIGSGIAFPAFLLHSVSRVNRGARYALVFFAHGEQPFR